MPAKLEKCVKKVMRTVKPQPGKTKKESAYGICVKSTGPKPKRRKKK